MISEKAFFLNRQNKHKNRIMKIQISNLQRFLHNSKKLKKNPSTNPPYIKVNIAHYDVS